MNLIKSYTILFIIIFAANSFSQTDSLSVGKNYKIRLYNQFEVEGYLSIVNDSSVTIITDEYTYIIPRRDIKSVVKADEEFIPEKFRQDKHYNDTTSQCILITKSRSKYEDVKLTNIQDSTFTVIKKDVSKVLMINDVMLLKFKSGGFVSGMLFGAGISTAFWLTVGLFTSSSEGKGYIFYFGLITIIPAGLIGGLIGALLSGEDVYDFTKLNFNQKKKKLAFILQKHS